VTYRRMTAIETPSRSPIPTAPLTTNLDCSGLS
jgi:hypothetical protein